MNPLTATSARDAVNQLAELLKKVHKPYAGAQVRIAFLRESGSQFSTGSVVFLPEPISPRPAADYGRLLFVEEWWNGQDEALDRLSNMLMGQAEVGRHKVNFQFNRSLYFYSNQPFGPHAWSRWECQNYTSVEPSLNQPLQHGPVLGFGLPPYLGPTQALQDWIFDFRPESADSQVPYQGQLVVFLPDLRARIVNALWTPGKLRVEVALNCADGTVELQVAQAGSTNPYQVCPAKSGVLDLSIPDDVRGLQIYLVHDSGDCIAHIQLRSLYDSFGEIGSELSATSQAEMDFGRGEKEQVEFKPFVSRPGEKEAEIIETVIAFANTAGGRLYIGVRDRDLRPMGEVELRKAFGKEAPVALREQADRVRWLITNKIVPIPTFSVQEIHPSGEPVVLVKIERGLGTLYGTRENQFFVRKDSRNFKPTAEELKNLLSMGPERFL